MVNTLGAISTKSISLRTIPSQAIAWSMDCVLCPSYTRSHPLIREVDTSYPIPSIYGVVRSASNVLYAGMAWTLHIIFS